MGYPITQNTATINLIFAMYDSTNHLLKAGLSPTVKLSKNGAAFGAALGAVTEVGGVGLGGGTYQVAANVSDSNALGPLRLWATATGADDAQDTFLVVAYNGQAATNLGLSNLVAPPTNFGAFAIAPTGEANANVTKVLGTASAGVAGYVGVDWSHVNAPTTVVALTNTTISTSQAVAAVTLAASQTFNNAGQTSATPVDLQTVKGQAVTCAAGVTVLASLGTAATSTAQTGDSFARIGLNGASLTVIGDTRLTNLDQPVSSRVPTTALPPNFGNLAVDSVTGGVVIKTNNDKTGYALTQGFPANFSSLAISVAGVVNAATLTNADKTGYALTQGFPANFSALVVSAAGVVNANVVDWLGVAPNALVSGNVQANSTTNLGANAPPGWINSAAFATGATLPVVNLVNTLTTYTGNTPQTGDAFNRIGVNGAGLTTIGNVVVGGYATGQAPTTAAQVWAYVIATSGNYPASKLLELSAATSGALLSGVATSTPKLAHVGDPDTTTPLIRWTLATSFDRTAVIIG